ncbi:MAG: hypothetical protein GYB64_20665 [Chloroflexi bacterium]|nr:hypothetical protein [Chloroflexota bacterium]
MTEAAKTKMTAAAFARLPETTIPTELIHGEVIVSPSPRRMSSGSARQGLYTQTFTSPA